MTQHNRVNSSQVFFEHSMKGRAVRAALARLTTAPRLPRRPPLLLHRRTMATRQEDIDEMNAEMSALFGSPVGDAGLSTGQQSVPEIQGRATSSEIQHAVATLRESHPSAAEATAALYARIAMCSVELGRLGAIEPSDLDRGMKLASNIAEAARAIRYLKEL